MKTICQTLVRRHGRPLYASMAPALRYLGRNPAGREVLRTAMHGLGTSLAWLFDAQEQPDARGVRTEWFRILRAVGLQPAAEQTLPESVGCGACFAECSAGLHPGDGPICDALMVANAAILRRVGGQMVIRERLTDPAATRCLISVESLRASAKKSSASPRDEQPLWCPEEAAYEHFDRAAEFYDFIMGYFEIPANTRAVRMMPRKANAHVVELGVGTGLGLRALLRRLPASARITAIDQSRPMLERARRRVAPWSHRVTFRTGDASQTTLPTASVDLLYSSFLLDLLPLPRRRAVLVEARRLLKPSDGMASFVVMDGEATAWHRQALASVYNCGYGNWNPIWMRLFQGYAPHCRPIHLRELLRDTGFRIVRHERSYVAMFPVAIYLVTA